MIDKDRIIAELQNQLNSSRDTVEDLHEEINKHRSAFELLAGELIQKEAKLAALAAQKPVAWQFKANNGKWLDLYNEYGRDQALRDGYEVRPLFREAPADVPGSNDYFAKLVAAARVSADKAMRKFPQPNYVLNKVAEESGEVIKAVIHYTEGREEWANVEGEIIDNLAMLIRLVTEGDQVIGFTPPAAVIEVNKKEGE